MLSSIISDRQSEFVLETQLMDGVLVANKVVNYATKLKKD